MWYNLIPNLTSHAAAPALSIPRTSNVARNSADCAAAKPEMASSPAWRTLCRCSCQRERERERERCCAHPAGAQFGQLPDVAGSVVDAGDRAREQGA